MTICLVSTLCFNATDAFAGSSADSYSAPDTPRTYVVRFPDLDLSNRRNRIVRKAAQRGPLGLCAGGESRPWADHHAWVSLGCAAENMAIAATALGKHTDIQFDPHEIRVTLESGPPAPSPLVDAIFQRQCTRAEYDGQPLAGDVLKDLERAADRSGVRLLLLTERARIESVIEYVTQANSAQMRDPAFVSELKHWIRFEDSQAVFAADGLSARSLGTRRCRPGSVARCFSLFFREKSENDRCVKQLRSSAAVAVFVGAHSGPANWFEDGRAYEHFALKAMALGVRTAFVNQPIEVPAVRSRFAEWLGIGSQRPELVVRLGRGPQRPYSLRRPVAAVIV